MLPELKTCESRFPKLDRYICLSLRNFFHGYRVNCVGQIFFIPVRGFRGPDSDPNSIKVRNIDFIELQRPTCEQIGPIPLERPMD